MWKPWLKSSNLRNTLDNRARMKQIFKGCWDECLAVFLFLWIVTISTYSFVTLPE